MIRLLWLATLILNARYAYLNYNVASVGPVEPDVEMSTKAERNDEPAINPAI